ncbi:unnamed protein product [Rodentolepis nana]|uniref:PHD-type domain-containing protein n=1 Tax=Rodentolepis nana TaxID=102285 RepID=A0A158QHA8_RODNA|nr:unnamed protein product [Rodentolepis nana]
MVRSRSELVYVYVISLSTSYVVNAADLNVRGLFYSNKDFSEAKWPLYLRRNVKLQPLWCGEELNFKSIIHFNQLIGSEDPFCSICAYFWSPPNMRKALCNKERDVLKATIPESTEPYLSEVVFCRSPDDFAFIRTRLNPTSRILCCARCKVVVHACCYGIDESNFVSSKDSKSERGKWRCDACSAAISDRVLNEPQCVLCPMRGGALKALANPRNSKRGERFWVHLGCAIAVGPLYCCFIDVPRRKPLLLRSTFPTSFNKNERSSRSSISGRSSISKSRAVSRSRSPHKSRRTGSLVMSLCEGDIDDLIDLTGIEGLEHEPSISSTRTSKRRKSSSSNSLRSPSEDHGIKAQKKLCSRPSLWTNSGDYFVEARQKRIKSSSKSKPESPSSEAEDSCRRDHCDECGLVSPGGPYLHLPLVSCWHEDCTTKFHLTCAQFGGVLIATSQYPHCFYITCRRHLSEYREFEHDEELPPLLPGDMVYALSSENGRYYKAIAMNPAGSMLCKLVFSDGTYSKDTPSDYILNHDWNTGAPQIGSKVKVIWTDGEVYTAVFQGASEEKWEV